MVACASKSENDNKSTQNTSTKETSPRKELTAEDYDVEEPIRGIKTDFTIKVNGLQGNFTSKLIAVYVDQNFVADTSKSENGVLHFQVEQSLPQGLYFASLPGNRYIQVLLGEDQEFALECDVQDITGSMKVEGSIENQMYYENARKENEINPKIQMQISRLKQFDKGSNEYSRAKEAKIKLEKDRLAYVLEMSKSNPNSLFTNFKISGQNPVINEALPENQQVTQYRKDFWESVIFDDRRLLHTPVIGNKLKRYFEELTVQHPDSIIVSADYLVQKSESYPEYYKVFTNWIVKKFEPTKCTLMDPEAVFVHMIQNYFTHEKAFWTDSLMVNTLQTRAYEMAQSRIGQPAPNVISTDQFGNKQELLSKTADYLIVYMFNPDCEHCMEQTPKLIKYYKDNIKEVDVMAIAIETTDKEWKDYAKKYNFPFTTVFDKTNRSIYAKYYVDVTPELYVINPDRQIIGKNLKVFQIQTVIDRDKEKRSK